MKKHVYLHVFLKEELVSRFADVRHNAKQRMLDRYGDLDDYDVVNFDIEASNLFEEVELVLERICQVSASHLGIFLNGMAYAKDVSRADQ